MVTIKMNALAKYGLLFAASCFLVAGWIVSPFPSLLGHPHTVLDGDAVSPPCTTPNLKTIFSRGGARLDPHDTVAMIKGIRPVAPTELWAEAARAARLSASRAHYHENRGPPSRKRDCQR